MRQGTIGLCRAGSILLSVLTALITPGSGTAAAKASDAPDRTIQSSQGVSVTIQEKTGAPDTHIVLPVSLAAAAETSTGELRLRIGFPKSLLRFQKAELTGVATALGVELRSDVQAGPSDDRSMLEVTFSAAATAKPRQSIPAGAIARLTFHIDKSAKVSTWIPLSLEVTASSTDDPPRAITPVTAYKTRIGVALTPMASCFFYMH